LSRQVRDKEEELEGTLQKMDALRNDLRRAEKLRRDLEARSEELQGDIVREKRLRERAEENARILQEDLERLQQKAAAGEAALNSLELNQELTRYCTLQHHPLSKNGTVHPSRADPFSSANGIS